MPKLVETPCSERADPRLHGMGCHGIGLTSELGLAPGRYALPDTDAPRQLVVMFHGHQNDSCAWCNHLRAVAARGAVAVAMDYSDQSDRHIDGHGFIENWGWAVRSGAADSVRAAHYFLERFPSIGQVFNFGTSMGANASGVAAYAAEAVRPGGEPLFNYWITTEGVHNLTEGYHSARGVAAFHPQADQVVRAIEQENGGSIEHAPQRYAEITNTQQARKLAYLKGAVLTHGTHDQTVPAVQSQQMADALRSVGVPTHLHLVAGSDHAWEGSSDAAVMQVGLDALFHLMAGGEVDDGQSMVNGP